MKRFILFLLAAVFLHSGCSKPNPKTITITWAAGKDITGTMQRLVREFERQNPGITVRTIEMPESASIERDSYVTYFIARDSAIDVYSIDITWPAEFAAARWILPLDRYFPAGAQKDFLPGPLDGCRYRGQLYAVPWFTDAGLLYYRADLLAREGFAPPATWQELVRQASYLRKKYALSGFVFQAEQYEGLICNFLEYLWSFGGGVFDPSGKPVIDSSEGREALRFLYDLIYANKAAPQDVLTFKEEESRQVFTSGRSVFLRNWPYVWKVSQDTSTSKVAGRVGIAPLPGRAAGGGVSCLGGWNLAVSRFSKHPDAAWKLIEFMTGPAAQKSFALSAGRLPTRQSVYADKDVLAAAPYFKTLYAVFTRARPRPSSPVYSKISDILQVEIHRALTNQQSVDTALRAAQEKIAALDREQ